MIIATLTVSNENIVIDPRKRKRGQHHIKELRGVNIIVDVNYIFIILHCTIRIQYTVYKILMKR